MSQPTYSSVTGYISEQFFTLFFDVSLDAAHPPGVNSFAVQINGTGVTVTGLSVNSTDKTVALTFSGASLTAGDIIEFSYTDPTGANDVNAIQGTDGTDAATFSASTVVSGGRPGPTAPAAPTLSSGSDSGTLGDGITQDNTPTLNGTAAANATVKLYDTDGTTLLGSTTADGSGNWSVTTSQLSDGTHSLKATQTDSGANTSPLSQALSVTIDTSASPPTTLALSAGSDSGTLGDGITNVGTPTVTGHSEAGATVRLYDTDGTTLLGSATANGGGNWSITSSTLAPGSHTLTAKQTDVAGNVSVASSGYAYILDTVGPVGMALSTTTVSQSSASNGATVATFSATDATAVSYSFAVGNGTIDADNGKFTISGTQLVAAQNLSAGTYHIYAKASDAAGNDAFQTFSVNVVDAPSVSSIVRASSATVPATGTSIDYTVTFSQSVTGVDASDFALTASGTASGTLASVTGSGTTYTVTVNGIGGDGTLRLDLNGSNTGITNGSGTAINGGYTAGQTFTLDHTAAAAPSIPVMTSGTDTGLSSTDGITSNTTPVFTGNAEANATVRLYDTDGTTLLGTTTANGSGGWSITSSTLAGGSHTVTAKQSDAAGNTSAVSAGLAVVIDTDAAAPSTPVLSVISDSGTLGDGITNIATPTITGTAEANASVTLYDTDGFTVLGTTTANGAGAWSITSSTLSNASHTLTTKQTDLAGNVSAASNALTLTVNTTAPAAPSTPALSTASDSGPLGDGITNIATPVITGTAAANAVVKLYDSNGTTVLGTATANGSGNWSINSSALSLGAHTLTAKQTDAAGNVSAASTPFALTIEAAPVAPSGPATAPTVDGVVVTQQSVSLPGGGTGVQTIIPIITTERIDSSGSSGVADIPLVTGSNGNLLLAQVPTGFGLTASGGTSQPAGTSTDQLIKSILAVTPGNNASDQSHLTGNGVTFLNKLVSTVPLLVETIVPSSGTSAPSGALTLTGTSNGNQHTALVIDASHLPAQSNLVLNTVDFAAVIGSVNVTGNTGGQILSGDAASQQFTVASGSASSVFAGGGNDTLHVTAPASTAGALTVDASSTLLHGGTGNDTAVFDGASSNYAVQAHEGYVVVIAKAQPSQQMVVINAESLAFSDTTVAIQTRDAETTLAGLYKETLGRQADYLGFDYWASMEKNGASLGQIAIAILNSNESKAQHTLAFNGNNSNDIEVLYQGIYGRHSEANGLAYWVNAMQQGMTLEQVAQNFATANEMTAHKVAAQSWDFLV